VRALQRSEYECCARIAAHGLEVMHAIAGTARARSRGCVNVLTHCNAGWLATGAWGTALAPVYSAAAAGIPVHVWVDETRPRNQGSRLTAWELGEGGIAHHIVADNCAGHLMQRGMVDVCIVGSDRTTRTGDVCNKIGTYQKALAAADSGVPFYVALPCSTIDWGIADGVTEIPIEERDPAEVLLLEGAGTDGVLRALRHAPPASRALNVAFDVTPARLVTGLICEHGVHAANAESLARLRNVAAGAPQRV
jgi:methylthioribose-1-phosphate isomerase